MQAKRNESIATIACPFRDCERVAKVFKYAARSDDDKRKRFAGKMYGRCELHGKFDDQEYILEYIQWPQKRSGAESAPPVEAPEKTAIAAVQSVKKVVPVPAVKAPESSSQSAVQSKQSAVQSKGWGFYQ